MSQKNAFMAPLDEPLAEVVNVLLHASKVRIEKVAY
jgi:hypothetical protein